MVSGCNVLTPASSTTRHRYNGRRHLEKDILFSILPKNQTDGGIWAIDWAKIVVSCPYFGRRNKKYFERCRDLGSESIKLFSLRVVVTVSNWIVIDAIQMLTQVYRFFRSGHGSHGAHGELYLNACVNPTVAPNRYVFVKRKTFISSNGISRITFDDMIPFMIWLICCRPVE